MRRKDTMPRYQFVRLCACGCGQPTRICYQHGPQFGQPNTFILGHQRRNSTPEYRVDEHGCWLWQRAIDKQGYGRAHDASGKTCFAHNLYWTRAHGAIPEGKVLDHVRARGCQSRACCNPAHLEPVTHAENVRRGRATRLNSRQVREIRALHDAGANCATIARRYGVHRNTIAEIVKRRNWRDVA